MNYISKPIRKSLGGFKNEIVSLFKTNTPKETMQERGKKLSKPRKINIKKTFISEKNKQKTKEEKVERKESEKK